jgi:hypothetical protein
MCYHDLYLYVACGHTISGAEPIENTPPCPAATRELFRKLSLASPISANAPAAPWSEKRARNYTRSASRAALGTCHEKLAHPLHTYRIEGLCSKCHSGREQRLAKFEVHSIKAGVERDFARRRHEEHERMKQSLKMMRDANIANKEAANLMAYGTDEGYIESIGRLMEGVKERMLAWDESLTPTKTERLPAVPWVGNSAVGGRH